MVTLARLIQSRESHVGLGGGLERLPVCGGCGCGNVDGRVRVSIHPVVIASSGG